MAVVRLDSIGTSGGVESKNPVDLYRSLSKGKLLERSRPATASMDMRTIASFLCEMKVTKPEVLRATPAHKALQGCGRALRANPDPMRLFALSQQVDERIDEFWSHSWHGESWKKILLLLVLKNGKAAVFFGTVGASLAMLLFLLGLLPGKTMHNEWRSYWSVIAGTLMAFVTLLFWKTRKMVFLDRVCVNQVDEEEKCEAILSIGGLLKSSSAMLVLWDTTYVERLWCVFELAAYIKSHDDARNRQLHIRPTLLGPCTCSIALGTTTFMLVWMLMPFDVVDPVLGSILLLALTGAGFFFAAANFRSFYSAVDTTQEQMRNFSVQGAKCACCDIGHTGEGAVMLCDRRIVLSCIAGWYGSNETFEESVQSVVRDTLARQLGQDAFPYSWFIGASAPVLWGEMDVLATRLRSGESQEAVYFAIVGLSWWLCAFPLTFLCWSKILYLLRHSGSTCYDMLMNVIGIMALMPLLCTVQLVQIACHELFENRVYAAIAFAAVWLFLSLGVHLPRLCLQAEPLPGGTSEEPEKEPEQEPCPEPLEDEEAMVYVHVSL